MNTAGLQLSERLHHSGVKVRGIRNQCCCRSSRISGGARRHPWPLIGPAGLAAVTDMITGRVRHDATIDRAHQNWQTARARGNHGYTTGGTAGYADRGRVRHQLQRPFAMVDMFGNALYVRPTRGGALSAHRLRSCTTGPANGRKRSFCTFRRPRQISCRGKGLQLPLTGRVSVPRKATSAVSPSWRWHASCSWLSKLPGAARCRPQRVTNEDQRPIREAYEIQGGCVTGTGPGLKDAAEKKGPIPPWSPRPRNAHEGFWNGLNPAGYKLVRRVPQRHAKGSPWIGTKP
jgi:hypothetical protein